MYSGFVLTVRTVAGAPIAVRFECQNPPPSRPPASHKHKHKSLLERLTAFIFREPENREDLLRALHEAHDRDLLDADALSMIEGVLQVSELRARDLMIPRSQMDMVDIADAPET